MTSSAHTTAEACVQQFTASNCNLAAAYAAATDDMMMVAGAYLDLFCKFAVADTTER
jgi:hypothetical protein